MKITPALLFLSFAATLAGCSSSKAGDAVPAAPAEENAVVPPARPAADAKTPPAPGAQSEKVRVSIIEFAVSAEKIRDFDLLQLGSGGDAGGALYNALLSAAKNGEAELSVISVAQLYGQTSVHKAATLLRYAESYATVLEWKPSAEAMAEERGTKPDQISFDGTVSSPVRGKDGKLILQPQDYTVQEVGLVMECGVVRSGAPGRVLVDLKPKRVSCDLKPDESRDSFGFPSQPRFSVWSLETHVEATLGEPAFVSEVKAAPDAKDGRTRFVFVRVD